MKIWIYIAILVLLASLLAACGRDSQSGSGAPAQTYSATVVEMDIVRSADGEPMPVDGLPATGAEVTVR